MSRIRKNPDNDRRRRRVWIARRRATLLWMLGARCYWCGTTENLEFDHKDPATKSFAIGGSLAIPFDRLVEELRKCQLLCTDCHHEKNITDNKTLHRKEHGSTYMWQTMKCRCPVCQAKIDEMNKRRSRLRREKLLAAGTYKRGPYRRWAEE